MPSRGCAAWHQARYSCPQLASHYNKPYSGVMLAPIGARWGMGALHVLPRYGRQGWCSAGGATLRYCIVRGQRRDFRNTSRAGRLRTNHNPSTGGLGAGRTIRQSQQIRYLSSTTSTAHNASPASSSVSASEVTHFSRLASSWWDPHGSSRLLHLMNPLRHDFIRSCMSAVTTTNQDPVLPTPNSLSYLDIGCGGGIFASSAARLPTTKTVTAIDPTPLCIEVAKSHARKDPALQPPQLNYLNCAIEDLATQTQAPSSHEIPKEYDILTLFEVIEHISQPASFLTSLTQHIKPSGWLIGSTIARSATSYITTKLIAEAPLIGVVPRGTHDWNQYINPSELKEYFRHQTGGEEGRWGTMMIQGVIYIPGLGWKMVNGSEGYGNYFFAVQKLK